MRRIVIFVTAVLLCLSLVGCSFYAPSPDPDTSGQESTDTTQDSLGSSPDDDGVPADRLSQAREEAGTALSSAPMMDYDGMSFIFTCISSEAVFGSADGETVLSREKYNRIKTLSDRLNVNIIVTETSYDEMVKGLSDSVGADVVYTHMMTVNASKIGTLSYNELIGNFRELPFIDLTKPYYDADVIAELSTPGGIYAVYGDGSRDAESLGAIFYNQRLAESLGYSELEGSVREGAWTLDKMSECVKAAHTAYTEGAGYLAAIGEDTEQMLGYFFVGSGMQSVTQNDKGKLVAQENGALGDRVVGAVKTLLSSYHGGGTNEKSAEQMFCEAGSLFYVGSLGSVKDIYNMSDVWGILPMPTVDGGTSYRTPIGKNTQVVCFPKGANANETAVMLESLFASSYKLIDAAVRDEFLHRYVRNAKAIEMLGFVLGDVRSDFVVSFGDEYTRYGDNTIGTFISSCYSDKAYSSVHTAAKVQANKSLVYVK